MKKSSFHSFYANDQASGGDDENYDKEKFSCEFFFVRVLERWAESGIKKFCVKFGYKNKVHRLP